VKGFQTTVTVRLAFFLTNSQLICTVGKWMTIALWKKASTTKVLLGKAHSLKTMLVHKILAQ
jgi:hypothetical protein